MRLFKLFEYEDLILEALRPSSETFDELIKTREYDIDKPFDKQEWFSVDPHQKQKRLKTNLFYKICKEHLTSFKYDIEQYVKKNKFVNPKTVRSNISITQSGLTNEKSLSGYVNFNLINGEPLIIRISDHTDINQKHRDKTYYIKLGRYLSYGIKKNIDDFINKKMGIETINSKEIKRPQVEIIKRRKIS